MYNSNITNFLKRYKISISFLILLTIQFNYLTDLNGLPIKEGSETILLIFFFPLLICFEKFNVFNNKLFYLLIFLISFKLILNSPLESGVAHKFNRYNQQNINNNNYIKTFDSIWYKKYSAIQKNSWLNKKMFPIDWTFRHSLNKKNEIEYFWDPKKDNYNNQQFKFYSSFYLYLEADQYFQIKTRGLNKGFISYSNLKENSNAELKLENFNKKIFLKKGIYLFNTESIFSGAEWSFQPEIYNKNNFISAIKNGNIFLPNENYQNFQNIKFYKNVSIIFKFIFWVTVICFLINIIRETPLRIRINSILFLLISLLSFSFFNIFFFPLINFNTSYLFSFYLGPSILLYYCFIHHKCFLLNKLIPINKLELNQSRNCFLSIFPTILIYFGLIYFDKINTFSWYSANDDWEVFRVFAREIAVDNIWVSPVESSYLRYRPGIRYFFAFCHTLFGKSNFIDSMLEIYAILFTSFFVFKICNQLKLKNNLPLLCGFLLLSFYFSGSYRWLIGRGLSEFYGVFCFFLVFYLLLHVKKNCVNFFLIGLLAGLTSWIREEYLLTLGSLIFYQFHNILIKKFSIKYYLSLLFTKENILYLVSLLLVFMCIFLKVYIDFGEVSVHELTDKMSILYVNVEFNTWDPFYRMLSGSDIKESPRFVSLFLFFGTFFAFFNFFKYFIGKNKLIFLAIALSFIGILAPYIFIHNLAYAPRYTIIFLPFCLISVFMSLEMYCKINNKYKNKFLWRN
jgi:hypothetical protein